MLETKRSRNQFLSFWFFSSIDWVCGYTHASFFLLNRKWRCDALWTNIGWADRLLHSAAVSQGQHDCLVPISAMCDTCITRHCHRVVGVGHLWPRWSWHQLPFPRAEGLGHRQRLHDCVASRQRTGSASFHDSAWLTKSVCYTKSEKWETFQICITGRLCDSRPIGKICLS